MSVQLQELLIFCLTVTQGGCMFPSNHWGDWNDSQLLPTIQRLMKGYNRYLRPNFNDRSNTLNAVDEALIHQSISCSFVLGMPDWDETPGKTQNTLEGLSQLAWERLVILPEELEEVVGGKRFLGVPAQAAAPRDLTLEQVEENGCMDGQTCQVIGPVEIGMSLDIASIDAISEINMDYTATIFLRQRWRDSRLVFPGNESVSVDGRLVSLLWIPDTFIPDSKRSFLHDVTVENRLIRIFSNGTVLYALRITATIACNMDLTKYPMDKQVCTLQLESWGYNIQDVVFYWTRGNDSVKGLDTLRLAQYSVESYYTSVSEAVYETGHYPKLVLHFSLRRNVLFFILETYVPSILLVVLSWVSFWISQSSVPARTCIGVTTVLTMTTLMMGARTSLPNANCFIKAIDVYLGICFTFIFGALLEYACAHFYSMQHQTIEDLQRELLREFCESNGNGSIPIVSSSQPNQSVEVGSTAEEPAEEPANSDIKDHATAKEKVPSQGCGLSSVKDASRRAASVFIVENPHNIDRHARTAFPTAFLFVNILYWLYYLFL